MAGIMFGKKAGYDAIKNPDVGCFENSVRKIVD